MLVRIWSKGKTPSLPGGIQMCTHLLWKWTGTFLRILWINRSTSITSYITSGHIPKRCHTTTQGHLLNYIYSILIHNMQNVGRSLCPSTENMIRKMWYIYTMEYYGAIKYNKTMKFASKWLELENMILREVTQTQKDKQDMFTIISGY